MARFIRIVVGRNEAELRNAAQDWTILENTMKAFIEMDSSAHAGLGDVGAINVFESGVVALAFKDQ